MKGRLEQLNMDKLKNFNTERDTEANVYLSIPFLIEMMESMKQLLCDRIDNLLIKMTQFVNGRVLDLQGVTPN
jgi:hypothetical protein